jgi:hypothetical protein
MHVRTIDGVGSQPPDGALGHHRLDERHVQSRNGFED